MSGRPGADFKVCQMDIGGERGITFADFAADRSSEASIDRPESAQTTSKIHEIRKAAAMFDRAGRNALVDINLGRDIADDASNNE